LIFWEKLVIFSLSKIFHKKMNIPIFQVDAFTAKPFAGNPAAVCILPRPMDEPWMQSVAREMNLSETAFLLRQEEGFHLRWFTPAVEVDLCGHATWPAPTPVGKRGS
jgi:PhzF family phenazine biosynthesis protein